MTGPAGVMSVILFETAVGGAVALWAGGLWGKVRRGFFFLTGVTLALCAGGAWAIVAGEGGAVAASAAAFTVALVVWQLLLLMRREAPARLVGVLAAAVGVVAVPFFAQLRDAAYLRAVAEIALGSVFLGSATYGLLLGHWYLVERRLDEGYMVRGALFYAAGVVAAVGAALLSALNPAPPAGGNFSPFLSTPSFTVLLAGGLVAICAIIAGFVWRLAREGGRSIQAATGYFYLAVIMAFSAEMASKFRFFS